MCHVPDWHAPTCVTITALCEYRGLFIGQHSLQFTFHNPSQLYTKLIYDYLLLYKVIKSQLFSLKQPKIHWPTSTLSTGKGSFNVKIWSFFDHLPESANFFLLSVLKTCLRRGEGGPKILKIRLRYIWMVLSHLFHESRI